MEEHDTTVQEYAAMFRDIGIPRRREVLATYQEVTGDMDAAEEFEALSGFETESQPLEPPEAKSEDPDHVPTAQEEFTALTPDEDPSYVATDDMTDEMTDQERRKFERDVERRRYEALVSRTANRMDAAEAFSAEDSGQTEVWGDEMLDADIPDESFLVEGLWPMSGRVNFSAQAKTGKTTTSGALVYSLLSGEPFLGKWPVRKLADGESITVFDVESTREQVMKAYRRAFELRTGRLRVVRFRENRAGLNFMVDAAREHMLDAYSGSRVYVMDNQTRLAKAMGLDTDSAIEAASMLAAWDQLVLDMGGEESLWVNHAGHDGTRSRGSSVLRDDADALWLMAKDASGKRTFAAEGRIEEVSKIKVELVDGVPLVNESGASQYEPHRAEDYVRRVLMEIDPGEPGMKHKALWEAAHGLAEQEGSGTSRRKIQDAIKSMIEDGIIDTEEAPRSESGHGGGLLHRLSDLERLV